MLFDRRRYSRQTVHRGVYVDLFPNTGGWLSNISEGGLALHLFFPVASDQAVHLGFQLPGTRHRIEANCEIAWIDKFGRKAGLRFLDLPEASCQQIREWLSVRTWQPAIPRPASRRNRIFVILVLLVISLVILYPFLQKWRPAPLRSVLPAKTTASRKVRVWVVKQTGLYYCPDSKLYGQTESGALMTEEKALERGYRPAGGETCR
jgi:PilZ domain